MAGSHPLHTPKHRPDSSRGERRRRRRFSSTCAWIAGAVALLLCLPAFATDYAIQSDRSRVKFEIGHSDYAKPVRGRFGSLEGEIGYDPAAPQEATAEVVIDASSIDTDNGYRDEHLRTSFFQADEHPEIRFRLIRLLFERGEAVGELTMRGVTRRIVMQVANLHEAEAPNGLRILRVRARTTIDRRDFGVEEDADRAEGLGKIMSHIQEGLDEFIDDEVSVRISVVAREILEDDSLAQRD